MNPNSNITRWVAFLLGPLAAVISGIVVHVALTVFGYHLDPVQMTAWVLGVLFLISVWLYNRGKYEIAHLLHLSPLTVEDIEHLIETKLPPAPPAPGTTPSTVVPPHQDNPQPPPV